MVCFGCLPCLRDASREVILILILLDVRHLPFQTMVQVDSFLYLGWPYGRFG